MCCGREERKGWSFLLQSYLSEFARSEGTELWILTSAYHSDADFDRQIRSFIRHNLSLPHTSPAASSSAAPQPKASDLAPVRLLKSGIPSTSLPGVYAAADCFVLPSRGEGWGRPHVEAMAMGLPVIATKWSGPSEYSTPTLTLQHFTLGFTSTTQHPQRLTGR